MTQDPVKILQKKVKDNWKQWVLAVISIAAFIAVWHLYSTYLHENDIGFKGYVPYPLDVGKALVDSFLHEDRDTGLTMLDHIGASLERVILGFLIAMAVAVPLGLLMGTFRAADAFGRPVVEMIRPIPPLAWIPIFIVILGMLWGPVAIVALGIFFPVLLNTMFGVRSVEPALMDAAKTLGADRAQMFLKVVLPFTTPYLMTGVKVGLGIGWMCIVAAEMVGNYGGGVGWLIKDTNDTGNYEVMYAGMIVIGLLGILTTGVAGLIEARLSKWMGMK